MRRYMSEKDPLLVRPRKREGAGSDRLCKLREWCRLGKHIVAHATYLQRAESAGPANADLLTRIEWLVPLPWVWESYVKLQLRERFQEESILGVQFKVSRLKKEIPHNLFPDKMARPDIVVWASHCGERRPIAVFDAKLYRTASQKAHNSHLWQVIAYAAALENQYRPTTWWLGKVAVGGLVYGYWKEGVTGERTGHCYHIDLHGTGVAQRVEKELDELHKRTIEQIRAIFCVRVSQV